MTGLSRSAFYKEPAGKRQKADIDLKDRIDAIHVEFPGYGYRRLKPALEADGPAVNWKRIRRGLRPFRWTV